MKIKHKLSSGSKLVMTISCNYKGPERELVLPSECSNKGSIETETLI